MSHTTPLAEELKALVARGERPNVNALAAKYGKSEHYIYDRYAYWRRTLQPKAPPTSPQGAEPNWESIEHLDRPARRQMLQRLARSDREDIQLKALAALEDLDRQSGSGPGPRPPISPEEKITRLSRLIAACGREIAVAAWQAAEDYWRQEATWVAPVIYDGTQTDQSQAGSSTERPGPETGPSNLG